MEPKGLMEDDWISVYSAGQYYQAQLAVDCLEEQGIEAVIVNKQDSTYLFGDVEVYVRKEQVIKAKYALKNASIE